MDKGLRLRGEDGACHDLTKKTFQRMIHCDGREFKICLKLTQQVLDVDGQGRQRVRPAAELLSHTVGKGILQHFGSSHKPQSDAVICIDRWFDTMNSICVTASNKLRSGFGIHEDSQLKALDDMEKLVYKMEFCNSGKYSRRGKLSIPFQKGILVSIKSTRALYQELKSSGSKYFLTCKVNSDHLENFFSRLRALGGHNHHPGPAEAVQRIRILLFGKSPQFVVSKPAVEEDNLEVTTVLAPGASQEELEPELSFEQLVTQELTADVPQLQEPEDDDDDDEDKKVGNNYELL